MSVNPEHLYSITLEAYGWDSGDELGFHDVIVVGHDLARSVAIEAAQRIAALPDWYTGPPKIIIEDWCDEDFTWEGGNLEAGEDFRLEITIIDLGLKTDLESGVRSIIEQF